jgi:hypothetical protein
MFSDDEAGLLVCRQGYNMPNLLIHWKVYALYLFYQRALTRGSQILN